MDRLSHPTLISVAALLEFEEVKRKYSEECENVSLTIVHIGAIELRRWKMSVGGCFALSNGTRNAILIAFISLHVQAIYNLSGQVTGDWFLLS